MAARNKLLQSLKIAVIAAILVNGQQAAAFPGELHQVETFFQRGGQGLVDHYIATRCEALPGDGMVRVVWCGDHNQSNVRHRQQLFDAAHDPRVRIELRCFVTGALQNCSESQARNSANHWRVKRAPCQAKSDESDVDHSAATALNADVERTRFPARRSYRRVG